MWAQLAQTGMLTAIFSFVFGLSLYEESKEVQMVAYYVMCAVFCVSLVLMYISFVGLIWS
jgi:hypothetical protein